MHVHRSSTWVCKNGVNPLPFKAGNKHICSAHGFAAFWSGGWVRGGGGLWSAGRGVGVRGMTHKGGCVQKRVMILTYLVF
jgi:hypothetical protein